MCIENIVLMKGYKMDVNGKFNLDIHKDNIIGEKRVSGGIGN
ncbi:MAG TPA: hypothetical protein PKB05_07415 [Oligoflexia bacterium]|nr:hypothetical protein [Oligoflexia bacterium]